MSSWGNTDAANSVPKFLVSNTDVYLVTKSRLANASFGDGKAVSHQGWVKVTQGTGFVGNLTVSNVSPNLAYANAFLTFSGANITPANAQIVVLNGNNVSVVINNPGAGYTSTPTVSATGANNASLVFTVSPGGRMGRIQTETLVALSNTVASDANSGGSYFSGV